MGTKIKKIGNDISNAGSSQHKWNKDGQDLEVFQQHEKNLFKVGEAGWGKSFSVSLQLLLHAQERKTLARKTFPQ